MPFQNHDQVKALFVKNPALARKWAHKYGIPKDLPEHGKRKKARKAR